MKAHLILIVTVGSLVSASEDPASLGETEAPTFTHAWADFDGDRLPDLFTVGPEGRPILLRNAGDGTFDDVSASLDVETDFAAAGAQWVDFDGDGRADLFLWTVVGRPHLLRNESGMNLVDVTELAGIEAGGVTAAEWVDYDADGRMDLVLTTTVGPALFHATGSATFERVAATLTGPASGGTEAPPVVRVAGESIAVGPTTITESPSLVGGTTPGGGEGSDAGTFTGTEPEAGRSRGGPAPSTRRGLLVPDLNAVGLGLVAAPVCVRSLDDMASGGCITASSTPVLGRLYPLSSNLFVATNGDVGLGTTSPAGELAIGNYQGGVGTSAVQSFKKQVVLTGPYNTGTNTGNSVKLLIADYDNDTSDIYPIYVEDEGNQVDFYVRKQGQQASTYMKGAVGIGGTPSPSFTMRVQNFGANNLSAARIETWDVNSTESALSAFHFGQGEAIFASASNADGIRGFGNGPGNSGVHGTANSSSGYGVLADSSTGTALQVSATSTSNAFPAARIQNSGVGPALQVLTSDPSSPLAAEFDGDLHVGVSGGLGVTEKVLLEINGNSAGEVRVRDSAGLETVVIQSEEFAASGGAQIQLKDKNGVATITMDADHSGSGRVLTEVLEITGGADLVESFTARGGEVEPGTVLVADAESPGELRVSRTAYDRAVVGVVSGAGGVRPGLRLAQADVLDGDTPVALSGRVYVKASTENGPIAAGDLLTTASLAGHAMRADDPARAFGSVIGKALSNLDDETGLVLVLVSLQ